MRPRHLTLSLLLATAPGCLWISSEDQAERMALGDGGGSGDGGDTGDGGGTGDGGTEVDPLIGVMSGTVEVRCTYDTLFSDTCSGTGSIVVEDDARTWEGSMTCTFSGLLSGRGSQRATISGAIEDDTTSVSVEWASGTVFADTDVEGTVDRDGLTLAFEMDGICTAGTTGGTYSGEAELSR